MDAYLAIVTRREVRRYLGRPIPGDVLTKILEAGRASGSNRNRQPWRFVGVTDRARLQDLGAVISRPANLKGCAAAVAIAVAPGSSAEFDAGRAGQNMMLAAWTEGIGSCPNTPTDEAGLKARLRIPAEMAVPTVLSLGYPAPREPRPMRAADPAGVLRRINRLRLERLVHREAYRG